LSEPPGTHSPVSPELPDMLVLERLMARRRSCRGFLPQQIPRNVITRLLVAAQRTPSWCNVQPWAVVIASGRSVEGLRNTLAAETHEVSPDLPFPVLDGVHSERRRVSGWQLYDAVGVAKGDREASAVQQRRNFEFFDAPHLALISTPRTLGPYGVLDCGLYIQSFLLAAEALGLGAIVQAAIAARAPALREWFAVPPDHDILVGISFGYPDLSHPSTGYYTEREDLATTVRWFD